MPHPLTSSPSPTVSIIPSPIQKLRKLYTNLQPDERLDFIKLSACNISRKISTSQESFEFDNVEVVRLIRQYVEEYTLRLDVPCVEQIVDSPCGHAPRSVNSQKCRWENLKSLYGRAKCYAPLIVRAFEAEKVSPVVGLYIAMIESEYHPCPMSSANARGMFQFIPSTARLYGIENLNDLCKVEVSAPKAALYISHRMGVFGTDSMSVPLAIAGYNRNPVSVERDLHDVINSENKERSFWTLVVNSHKLDHWFRGQNIKYVPKFFAAAIIGENPDDFGLDQNPLSTYKE